MEGLEPYIVAGLSLVAGVALTLLISKAKDILVKIKESETTLDDKLVLAVVREAVEMGILSQKTLDKVEAELGPIE